MKKYIIQENLEELTPEQINDPNLFVIINKLMNIEFHSQYKCIFQIDNSSIRVYTQNDLIIKHSTIFIHNDVHIKVGDSSTVYAYDDSHVNAKDNAFVVLYDRSTGTINDRSQAHCYGTSIVHCYNRSQVSAYGNSTVYSWNTAHVFARNSSTIYASHYSQVETSSSETTITAYDRTIIHNDYCKKINMYHDSVIYNNNSYKDNIFIKNNATLKQINNTHKNLTEWINNNNCLYLTPTDILLYKAVSTEYKTQENTSNETSWLPGTIVEMPMDKWNPDKEECGEGKFHACAYPLKCCQYRSNEDKNKDKFIAISVNINDVFVWTNGKSSHPKKIAFRKGIVLYECDINGNKITNPN